MGKNKQESAVVKEIRDGRRALAFRLNKLRHLGAVGCAAALALAAVLALATVVAGLAATLPFTVVLAFTRVLGRLVLIRIPQTGFGGFHCGGLRRVGGSVRCNAGSADQARESGRQEKCIQLILHD